MIGWLITIGILYWLLKVASKSEHNHKNKYYTLKTAKYLAWSWIFGFIFMVIMLSLKIINLVD